MSLTDEQCDSFRRHPGSFNDIIRAVYAAGANSQGKYTEADMIAFANFAIIDRADYLGNDANKEALEEWLELKKEGGLP